MYIGDWSSDVCSSDLSRPGAAGPGGHDDGRHSGHARVGDRKGARGVSTRRPVRSADPQLCTRSEERRVGKECGSRRPRSHDMKIKQKWNIETTSSEMT